METSSPTIDAVMSKVFYPHRYYWCGRSYVGNPVVFACACMGCANGYVQQAGYTEKEWAEWCGEHLPMRKVSRANFNEEAHVYVDPHVKDLDFYVEPEPLLKQPLDPNRLPE